MEAFAVATVAREFGLLDDTYIIKAVSDWADSDASDAHEDNLDFAMNNSLAIFKKVLEID
jgi:nucleoside phosphorylase